MGIKDLDALAKTIKPFRQDICEAPLNNFGENVVASSSVALLDTSPPENHLNAQRQRQRRPDRAVYVPRGRRSQPASAPTLNSGSVTKNQIVESVDSSSPVVSSSHYSDSKHQEPVIDTQEVIINQDVAVEPIGKDQPTLVVEDNRDISAETQPIDTVTNMADANVKCEGSKIESSLNTTDKDYNEEKEFQRASKEINRRNRRIIKQTFDSDVLEINEAVTTKPLPSETESKSEKKPKLPHVETQSNADSTPQPKRTEKSNKKAVNAETDDWESMFDDNGDCLDSKLMTEITSNVGKVSISKPKNDYKSYQDPVNLDDEEFPHVLEISNFPVEFKTQDLMMIFSEYKELGFDIKWVDDTHALVVFSSSKVAARALNTGHPFIKLKPLTQATAESKARAKKNALFLQPYRQRPETCAALARRLVTGALGVRLSTAREEREIERRVLKEAKERKLLAAKMRDEAWEN